MVRFVTETLGVILRSRNLYCELGRRYARVHEGNIPLYVSIYLYKVQYPYPFEHSNLNLG